MGDTALPPGQNTRGTDWAKSYATVIHITFCRHKIRYIG
jgi:hypothetical protein